MKTKARVLVNGIGTVGKRIAHAIKLQSDMELVGIADVAPTPTLKTVLEPKGFLYGTRLYASNDQGYENLKKAGMWVEGKLEDLLRNGAVDIVIDAAPEGIGALNKQLYQKYGVKAIFQGGEKADVAEMSFNAIVNYEEALGKNYVRVPSCNTTGLIRSLSAIDFNFEIEYGFIALVRRSVDPHEYKKGPINAIEFDLHVPSHHAPDVKTVLKHLNLFSLAVKVPTTLSHVHIVDLLVKRETSYEEVLKAFENQTRVITLSAKEYPATSVVIEKFRDYLRPRYDVYELIIFKDLINVDGKRIRYVQQVHQEAIIVPENVDAVRAMLELEKNKWESIRKTNESLGIIK